MSPTARPTASNADASSPAGADFVCPHCGTTMHVEPLGHARKCPKCRERLRPTAQLEQLLARWYEPRRWRADLVRPSVPYLIERLWTADGQGERLYQGVSPAYTNYDIFRHLVTRLIMQGIDDGWVNLTFPADPLAEDPQYQLNIVDSEKFARGVERLFPEVNWDEPVEIAPETGEPVSEPAEGEESSSEEPAGR